MNQNLSNQPKWVQVMVSTLQYKVAELEKEVAALRQYEGDGCVILDPYSSIHHGVRLRSHVKCVQFDTPKGKFDVYVSAVNQSLSIFSSDNNRLAIFPVSNGLILEEVIK